MRRVRLGSIRQWDSGWAPDDSVLGIRDFVEAAVGHSSSCRRQNCATFWFGIPDFHPTLSDAPRSEVRFPIPMWELMQDCTKT